MVVVVISWWWCWVGDCDGGGVLFWGREGRVLDEINIEVGGWAAGWLGGGWVACGMLDASAATGAHCLLWLVAVVPHPSCTQGALLSLLLLPCCSAQVMRNTLYKAYLDDFSHFVHRVGGTTGQVMGELLSFEVGLLLEVDLGGGWPPG